MPAADKRRAPRWSDSAPLNGAVRPSITGTIDSRNPAASALS